MCVLLPVCARKNQSRGRETQCALLHIITHTPARSGVGTTEVFSTRIRAKALSLAVSSNRVIAGVMAMSTLPLLNALTTRCVGLAVCLYYSPWLAL